jgi:hypothetical protein
MRIAARFATAVVLSLAVSGAVQQAIMMADHAAGPTTALPPLAIVVLLIAAVFGVVVRWNRRPAAVGWTAASMLMTLLVFGVIVYVAGVSTLTPELGGNIGYGLALIVDFYFLVPAALAVAIHWWLMRSGSVPAK